ncbi:MAG: ornithine--oxo-acid transaminase [Bacteroidetes bacterium]|nr:ornithine--oxo-acid transaminase [Bacteroidota bacterium]
MHSPSYYMQLEEQFGAHNYHPLPVVIAMASGCEMWDVEGKRYYDFLSGYSAVNQGHCHPRIIAALHEQAEQLTLTSRAFYNNRLGEYQQFITSLFGFDKMLPMNSGAEAVETAIKLSRKWGYEVKGVAPNKAKIVVCEHNFHGRTSSIVSFSSDPHAHEHFGPYMPGFQVIPYNDLSALEQAIRDPNTVAFLFEPIQGEAGIIVPHKGFLTGVRALCDQYGVLMMADEIQTGLCRTGKMLCCDHEHVQPDVLILGKALSGGTLPVSAVLASDEVMLTIRPGQHGSTFGGSPLASAVAVASLQVLLDEQLADNAARMGELFRAGLYQLQSPYIREIRGMGLMNAIEIQHPDPQAAWQLCEAFMQNGLLAKPTHGDKIRFAPPLVITASQIKEAIAIIAESLPVLELQEALPG